MDALAGHYQFQTQLTYVQLFLINCSLCLGNNICNESHRLGVTTKLFNSWNQSVLDEGIRSCYVKSTVEVEGRSEQIHCNNVYRCSTKGILRTNCTQCIHRGNGSCTARTLINIANEVIILWSTSHKYRVRLSAELAGLHRWMNNTSEALKVVFCHMIYGLKNLRPRKDLIRLLLSWTRSRSTVTGTLIIQLC